MRPIPENFPRSFATCKPAGPFVFTVDKDRSVPQYVQQWLMALAILGCLIVSLVLAFWLAK
jgi:hypothetical protein